MNDKESSERFNQDLDRILKGEEVRPLDGAPGAYEEMLHLAQAFAASDLSADSRIRTSLAARLRTRSRQPSPQRLGRLAWAPALAMLALLAAIALARPEVRAAAAGFLRQIGLIQLTEDVIFTHDNVQLPPEVPDSGKPWFAFASRPAEQTQPGPKRGEQAGGVVETPQPTVAPGAPVEIEVDFPLLLPAHLPAGYAYAGNRRQVLPAGYGMLTVYQTADEANFMAVDQALLKPDAGSQKFPVGSATVHEVSVRGQQGAWIEGAPTGIRGDGKGHREVMLVNYLVWEEEGYSFVLSGNRLTLEEALLVAESMAK